MTPDITEPHPPSATYRTSRIHIHILATNIPPPQPNPPPQTSKRRPITSAQRTGNTNPSPTLTATPHKTPLTLCTILMRRTARQATRGHSLVAEPRTIRLPPTITARPPRILRTLREAAGVVVAGCGRACVGDWAGDYRCRCCCCD
jgi:hypothetical protein